MRTTTKAGLLVVALLAGGCGAIAPQGQALVTEEFMIPGADPGVQLYVRNKRPRDLTTINLDNIVLFIHGATYPSETSFDLQLDGMSWMDYIASRGYDVYLMDVRGYGKSSRPAEMDQPADRTPPLVRTETAVRDFGTAVDFVLKRRSVSKLNVLGWSWGTTVAAAYTTKNNEKVNRLVLYAPQWVRKAEDVRRRPAGKLGAYSVVKPSVAVKRRYAGIPADKAKEVLPDAWAQEWMRATFASDPVGAKANPPFLRAPSGAVQDGREYWSAGKALYDPADIRVPTMIVRGEWDVASQDHMARGVYEKLANARSKRLVTIPEGAHGLMMERNRMQLFREVQRFLEEPMAQQ
jgi:pimeloyl-ACP methyl ester carboxylesterase